MPNKYPQFMNFRLTDEDMEQIEAMSVKLHAPRSCVVRRAIREWLASMEAVTN